MGWTLRAVRDDEIAAALCGLNVGRTQTLAFVVSAAWGAALLTLLPNWTNDLAHSVSLSTRVSANLPLAIYGVVLMGAMIVWPSGIQGGLRVLGARLRGAPGGPGAHSRSRAAAGS